MDRVRPSVLLVDDSGKDRAILRRLLEEDGVQVAGEAGDGLEAVELAWTLDPDVVLMDLRMPDMDGFEATRRIVQAHPRTQVLILTAYDDERLDRSALEAGAYAYLVKGCSISFIHDMIAQASKFKAGLEEAHALPIKPF